MKQVKVSTEAKVKIGNETGSEISNIFSHAFSQPSFLPFPQPVLVLTCLSDVASSLQLIISRNFRQLIITALAGFVYPGVPPRIEARSTDGR